MTRNTKGFLQTSCLTEHFFDRALERAQYLDDYLKREKRVIGPLHGLPISLKDSFCIKGIQSTVGYVAFLENPPAETNSALVDLLLDLGAVLYVKTNIPQTMMVSAPSESCIVSSDALCVDRRFREQHLRSYIKSTQYKPDGRRLFRW